MPMFGPNQRDQRGSAREPFAAATLLPTVSLAPVIAFGLARMIPNYSGPVVNAIRLSDSATMDIGAFGSSALDRQSALAFQGSSTLYAALGYDQSGNGNHLYETVQANRIRLFLGGNTASLTSGRLTTSTTNGEGNSTNAGGALSLPRRLRIPSLPAVDRQAITVFAVYRGVAADRPLWPWEFGDVTGATSSADDLSYHAGGGNGLYPTIRYDTTGNVVSPFTYGPALHNSNGLNVMAVRSSASQLASWRDGNKSVYNAVVTSKLLSLGGQFGCSHTANAVNVIDAVAFVVYPGALTDAEVVSVSAALRSIFHTNNPSPAINIFMQGDSQVESIGCFNNLTMGRQLSDLIGRDDVVIRNFGVAGSTASGNSTFWATGAQATKYQIAGATNILICGHGGNDILNSGATGATTYDYICTNVAAAKALGWSKVFGWTPCDVGTSTFIASTSQQTEMANLRTLIKANGGKSTDGSGKLDGVIDFTTDTTLCTTGCITAAQNTAYFYTDALHLIETGVARAAPIIRAALATAGVC